jgi:hypothetical protein
MPRRFPAEAGFFRVVLRVPAQRDVADDFHEAFDAWIGGMAGSEHAKGLGIMPSIRLEAATEDYAEIVLEWDDVPADGPWAAVEDRIDEVAKLAFPDMLKLPDELVVTVTRTRRVGRDIVLDDPTLERLDREATEMLDWPGEQSDA